MRKAVVVGLLISLGCLSAASPTALPQEEPSEKAVPTSVIATGQAKFSLGLVSKLAAAQKSSAAENIIVSPASLASVFALLNSGADHEMSLAMSSSLGFSSLKPAAFFATLRASRATWAKDEFDVIQAADKVVLDPSVEPYPITREALARFGAEVSVEDLTKPEAIARINDWVKAATHGLIPQILDGPLDKPAFVALNALHFKGRWQTRFDPERTKPAPFTGGDGKRAEVAMMYLSEGRYAFRSDDKHVAVDLPFVGERFSLVVVTTKDKPAKVADFEKVADWLAGDGFSARGGSVALPRLSLSGRDELLPALDTMGLAKARHSPTALGGFAPGATLSRIVQRAVLEVNEEGAEAAAATAAVTERSVGGESPIHMMVDKPFVYALRDRQTGLVVIAGYVGQVPQSKAP